MNYNLADQPSVSRVCRSADRLGANELHEGQSRSLMQAAGLSWSYGSMPDGWVAVLTCCTSSRIGRDLPDYTSSWVEPRTQSCLIYHSTCASVLLNVSSGHCGYSLTSHVFPT